MRVSFLTLDRYLLVQVVGTLVSVIGIVLSLMLFEHIPRLFDVVRLSGRKVSVVLQSMTALLPEYAVLGLLFGIYLAIALTVRRLSLRGELDIFEAMGIPPWRWMRFPAVVAAATAALLLLTQGWLMPAGERRLDAIGKQMEEGRFGFDLQTRQFTDLGNGVTVRFEDVEQTSGKLLGVFLRSGDTTFDASRGKLGFNFAGDVLIELEDGSMTNARSGNSLSFAQYHLDNGKRPSSRGTRAEADHRDSMTEAALLQSDKPADRAAAWSRLLWPVFALMVPFLALVLGKTARRSSSSVGLMAGLVLLVLFIRTAGIVETTQTDRPGLFAATVGIAWAAAARLLVQGERLWGAGYVDAWFRSLAGRVAKRR